MHEPNGSISGELSVDGRRSGETIRPLPIGPPICPSICPPVCPPDCPHVGSAAEE